MGLDRLKSGKPGINVLAILGLKRHRFGALSFFFPFLTQGIIQNDSVLDKLK